MSRAWSMLHLIALAVTGAPEIAFAQEEDRSFRSGGPLTLGAVLASVETHHPALIAGREQIRAAEGEALSSEGAFDLSLVADGYVAPLGYYDWGRARVGLEQPTPLWGARFYAGWRIGSGEIPAYRGGYGTLDGGELSVGARIPLLRDGPIDAARARRRRADQQVDIAEASLSEGRLSLRLDASVAYFRWVAAGRRYEIAQQLLSIAETRQAQLAAKVEAGHLPAIESLENQRVVVARRTALVSAERAVEQAAIALSLYYRDRAGSPRVPGAGRLPRDLPPLAALRFDLRTAVDRAWNDRPESARYQARIAQQEVSLSLAENARAPRIDFGIGASVDLGDGTDAQREVLGPAVVEASLTFALPLQNREARGNVVRIDAELAGLTAEARLARDRVEAQVRDAHSAVRAAERSLSLAREAADVADAVAAAERTRFELGATQLFVVNLREEAAAAAKAVVVDAEASLHVAHAALDRALGRRAE